MSCFRDDIVFLIYLYQRHIYPVDKARNSLSMILYDIFVFWILVRSFLVESFSGIFDEDFVDSAEGTAEERLNNNRDRSQ